MARSINKLSARAIQAISTPGRYGDGDRLFFVLQKDGSRGWYLLYTIHGKRREMSLGPYPLISLAEARLRAGQARRQILDGIDPLKDRDKAKRESVSATFGVFADAYIDEVVAPPLRSAKHLHQWRQTLGDDYCKALRAMPISAIGVEDVLAILRPIWAEKPETASRIRGRLRRVLGAAAAQGLRPHDNPAQWRGLLEHHLPARQKLTRGHHAALPYEDAPAFFAGVRARNSVSARACEFMLLTVPRAGEATGALWSEIDEKAKLWVLPPERTKMNREHRIPLSPRALEVLEAVKPWRVGDYVFPGAREGRPITREALEKVATSLAPGITLHGFRSTFRDWAGDQTDFPRELAEAALAHVSGSEIERAYRRSDALERRRALMLAWEAFLSAPQESPPSQPEDSAPQS